MKKLSTIVAFFIIASAVVLAAASSWNDSYTYDEIAHVGAGYSYLKMHDMRLNPEHPPLVKDLSAVPLLFLDIEPGAFNRPEWTNSHSDVYNQWRVGHEIVYYSGADGQLVTRLTHIAPILFFIVSAWFIFFWTRKLYGQFAGVLAVFIFSLSPTIIAHSKLVTTDIPALCGIVASTFFFINYLRNPRRSKAIFTGLILGLTLLTKFSTVLLFPFFGFLAIAWSIMQAKNRLKHTGQNILAIAGISVVALGIVVWPIYMFHVSRYPAEMQKSDTAKILETFRFRPIADTIISLADKPVIRSLDYYVMGVMTASQRAAGGNTTYFRGEVSSTGSREYFPFVYFIKEPLAWWALVVVSIIAAIWRSYSTRRGRILNRDYARSHFEEFAMLSWLALYWFISIKTPLNIGVRHLMPVYGFTIILVAGQIGIAASWLRDNMIKSYRSWISFILIISAWYVFENLNVFPSYLSYFNQFAGGPSGGYRYTVDSNLDWGQDLYRLEKYLDLNDIEKIEVDYFGWADQNYYLKGKQISLWSSKYTGVDDFLAHNQTDGWLAVSATFLQGSIGLKDRPEPINYNWLKQYTPKIVIGNSIFVWQITE